MLPAREFYKLQTMQRQGKLAKNPRASAMVDQISETLSKVATHAGNQSMNPILVDPTKAQKSNDAKTKKKRKRKKQAKTDADPSSVNQKTVVSKAPESVVHPPSHSSGKVEDNTTGLNRKQRKKMNKKLNKTAEKPVSNVTVKSSSNGQTLAAAATQKRPLSPNTTTQLPSKKKKKLDMIDSTDHVDSLVPVNDDDDSINDKSHDDESDHEVLLNDPIDIGLQVLQDMLKPVSPKLFIQKYFEKQPLHLKRRKTLGQDWLSTREIDSALRKQRVMFTEHLDLAIYRDGHRETLNPPGRAFRSVVWDHYNTGCSIRLLCPQLFFPDIRHRLSLLQEYFGCFVGANAYLTPPESQGFAPHYDDIEAFIMQMEGSKCWRVYAPRDESEHLPRKSSPNFSQENLGEPVLSVTLTPGDLLYLPRGYIHQGYTTDTHSLHLTVSTYQKHSWGDLLEKVLPICLESAMETDVKFREGLPIGCLRHLGGFSNTGPQQPESVACVREMRAGVASRLRALAITLESYNKTTKADVASQVAPDPLLVGADLMAVDLVATSLPPQLFEDEQECHAQKQGEKWFRKSAGEDDDQSTEKVSPREGVVNVVELEPDTLVRLIRWSAVRAVRTRVATTDEDDEEDSEDGDDDDSTESSDQVQIAVYHSLSNTTVYRERELDVTGLEMRLLPALDHLARKFPTFVAIDDLPLPTTEDRMEAAVGLYEAGFLVTSMPLPPTDSDDEDDDDDESSVSENSSDDEDDDDDSSEQSQSTSDSEEVFSLPTESDGDESDENLGLGVVNDNNDGDGVDIWTLGDDDDDEDDESSDETSEDEEEEEEKPPPPSAQKAGKQKGKARRA